MNIQKIRYNDANSRSMTLGANANAKIKIKKHKKSSVYMVFIKTNQLQEAFEYVERFCYAPMTRLYIFILTVRIEYWIQ